MTEERARYYAKALARGMGTTFYAVRSREGRFMAVQIPSDDCETLAVVTPPAARSRTQYPTLNKPGELLNIGEPTKRLVSIDDAAVACITAERRAR